MFDLPLHPIAVHFPIVIGMTLPFIALGLWWAIKKGHTQQKAWVLITALALAYGVSALVASELGEDDEDKVEKVVSEKVIEEHEEAAELIPWVAGGLVLISLGGLMARRGAKAQLAFVVLSLAGIVPLANTGHTGGELVYHYGAANAHVNAETKALIQSGQFYLAHAEEEHEKDHD
jgi:uncharacterized membrane protein